MIKRKRTIFVYPNSPAFYVDTGNPYIKKLIESLGRNYTVINSPTHMGLLDVLRNIRKFDIIYFNWIEDVVDRRFGFLQVRLLVILVRLIKIMGKKIVYFVHNNLSHNAMHLRSKTGVQKLLLKNADLILSHSKNVNLETAKPYLKVFHHPLDPFAENEKKSALKYDLLIWGKVSPYKGILEFVKFASRSTFLQSKNILIAGKFSSDAYYDSVSNASASNITIWNRAQTEEELAALFSESRYVLFTYNSTSVLSSAALSKSLACGAEVIAPLQGSFSDLAALGLLHGYNGVEEIEGICKNLQSGDQSAIDVVALNRYVAVTSWDAFGDFLHREIEHLFKHRP